MIRHPTLLLILRHLKSGLNLATATRCDGLGLIRAANGEMWVPDDIMAFRRRKDDIFVRQSTMNYRNSGTIAVMSGGLRIKVRTVSQVIGRVSVLGTGASLSRIETCIKINEKDHNLPLDSESQESEHRTDHTATDGQSCATRGILTGDVEDSQQALNRSLYAETLSPTVSPLSRKRTACFSVQVLVDGSGWF